jgi:type IV secretory pathway VirB10-like protein
MSEPVRLLDDPSAPGSVTELVRAIEAPSPLGDAGRAALAARITASAATAPTVVTQLLTLKAGFAALVAGGGIALFVIALDRPESAPSQPAPVAVSPVAPTPKPELAPPVAAPPTEATPVEPARKPPNARPSARDTLALEESLLERARESLATPARALSLLAEHERRFPSGELTAERLYLSARAHQKAGNTAQAQRYARTLAQRFPKSTYLAGLKSLLETR